MRDQYLRILCPSPGLRLPAPVGRGSAPKQTAKKRGMLSRFGRCWLLAPGFATTQNQVQQSKQKSRHNDRIQIDRNMNAVLRQALESEERELRRTNHHSPRVRSEEHTSELQSLRHLVCRLLLEKKKKH